VCCGHLGHSYVVKDVGCGIFAAWHKTREVHVPSVPIALTLGGPTDSLHVYSRLSIWGYEYNILVGVSGIGQCGDPENLPVEYSLLYRVLGPVILIDNTHEGGRARGIVRWWGGGELSAGAGDPVPPGRRCRSLLPVVPTPPALGRDREGVSLHVTVLSGFSGSAACVSTDAEANDKNLVYVTAQALVLSLSVNCPGFILFGFVALCSLCWRCTWLRIVEF